MLLCASLMFVKLIVVLVLNIVFFCFFVCVSVCLCAVYSSPKWFFHSDKYLHWYGKKPSHIRAMRIFKHFFCTQPLFHLCWSMLLAFFESIVWFFIRVFYKTAVATSMGLRRVQCIMYISKSTHGTPNQTLTLSLSLAKSVKLSTHEFCIQTKKKLWKNFLVGRTPNANEWPEHELFRTSTYALAPRQSILTDIKYKM